MSLDSRIEKISETYNVQKRNVYNVYLSYFRENKFFNQDKIPDKRLGVQAYWQTYRFYAFYQENRLQYYRALI